MSKDIVTVKADQTVGIEIEQGPNGVIAVYFRISQESITETVEIEKIPDVFVDLDKKGNVVGVEMINPKSIQITKLIKKVSSDYGRTGLNNLTASRVKKLQELIGAN